MSAIQELDRTLEEFQLFRADPGDPRGFNEGLLFADAYLVDAVVQVRYLLDQNAYLFAFSDIAYVMDWIQTFTDYIGVGLGLSFEVQTGVGNQPSSLVNLENHPLIFLVLSARADKQS
ncbi:unnamed protein product [Bathycoccus prasinos]